MYRSFTDRVLGGVCGGIAANWRLSSWLLRLLFIILTTISLGIAALLYLALWWVLPQESPVENHPQRGTAGFIVLLLTLLILGAWLAGQAGILTGPDGQNIALPGVLLLLSLIYFFRQVRG